MTRVEIQSGTDVAPSESLSEVFQVCGAGETRGWCVGPGAPGSSAESAEAASERRRG